jgi:hypothetical protein
MALGRKAPKPQMMAVYYARLTRIFTVSGSHLYNGYAWCVTRRAMFRHLSLSAHTDVHVCGRVLCVCSSHARVQT